MRIDVVSTECRVFSDPLALRHSHFKSFHTTKSVNKHKNFEKFRNYKVQKMAVYKIKLKI